MSPPITASRMIPYWVMPAAPFPSIFPASIWRGVVAFSINSMTRLPFSSATLIATQTPYVTMAMKIRTMSPVERRPVEISPLRLLVG